MVLKDLGSWWRNPADIVILSFIFPQVISEPIKSMAEILVDVCAYAGTGNVLKIQNLLHICSEHYEEKDEV